ncbi:MULTISPECIES: ABC transporter ATP-binding protein [unclassified Brevundimonas]|uniref:ABC transporter ATP-binding protein n=1 Tax=unclassified Brevundimonas TaxID=2622653 RepID=UPI0025C1B43F|nr:MULTISPECIES: ABC transporter ATP-binding protein [unclassified Brevundimonas]
MSLLQIRDISVSYGDGPSRKTVLADASLTLEAGQVAAIVGESGSGKSSLVRAVAGLVDPAAGEILLNGQKLLPLRKRDKATLHAIQMVFQDPGASLNPRHTAGQILDEALLVKGGRTAAQRKSRTAELLALVHLDERLAGLRPAALSGGQKQRLAIARALAMEPQILIADEALSALDFANQDKISTLLQSLTQELGLAMLFVSHDMRSVRRMADQVCVIQNGRIIEQGPVAQVLYHPSTAYTQLLLAAALNPTAALADPRLSALLEDGAAIDDGVLAGVMEIIRSDARMPPSGEGMA